MCNFGAEKGHENLLHSISEPVLAAAQQGTFTVSSDWGTVLLSCLPHAQTKFHRTLFLLVVMG